jgi:CheY-like chemotaxis protein
MIVDSDPDRLSLLKSILGLKGFDVLEAVNETEAFDLTSRWHPELILMELRRPIMSGFAAVRRIRKLTRARHTPIIAFSLPGPDSQNRLALAAGCVAHLEEPLDFDHLDALIDQYLPGHRWELASVLVH